jgi:hypothetical protein
MALDPITAGIGLLDNFIDKFVADKDLAAKLGAQARSAEFQGELQLVVGQLEINREEAASGNMFVAGWRPFVGWVCGMALAYNYIGKPFLEFGLLVYGMNHPLLVLPPLPQLDSGELMTVLMGMLGLGGLRTFEKVREVSREAMPTKGKK